MKSKIITKFFFTLIVIIISLNMFGFSAYANDKLAVVYAEKSFQSVNNALIIPIKIKRNPGIMGFKITVKYSDGIVINSVSKGEITEDGVFAENANSKAGEFDVVWSNSSEINSDGTLFFFGILANNISSEEIEIEYSQNDTFNEKFENVELVFNEINLNDDFISGNSFFFEDKFEHTAFVNDVSNSVLKMMDKDKFIKNADNVIKSTGVSTILELQENELTSFFDNGVEKVLSELSPDVKKDVIHNVYEYISENSYDENQTESNYKSKSFILIIPILILIFILILIIIYMRKRK